MSDKPKSSGEFVLLTKDEYEDLMSLLRDIITLHDAKSRNILDIRMALIRLENKRPK